MVLDALTWLVRRRLTTQLARIWRWLRLILFTAVTVVIALIRLLNAPETHLRPDWFNPGDLFLAAGSLIGTVLALVVTLSIIPVQRAAEIASPMMVRRFRTDSKVWLYLGGLAGLSGTSFGLFLMVDKSAMAEGLIVLEFVVIGMALDIAHVAVLRILELLDPRAAVKLTVSDYVRDERRIVRGVVAEASLRQSARFLAPILRWMKGRTEAEYGQSAPDTGAGDGVDDLREFGLRAIDRGEIDAVRLTTKGMTECAIARFKTFEVLAAESLPTDGFDVAQCTLRIREDLHSFSRRCSRADLSLIDYAIADAFSTLACDVAQMRLSAPLAETFIFALRPLVDQAASRCDFALVLQITRSLAHVAKTQRDVAGKHLYQPVTRFTFECLNRLHRPKIEDWLNSACKPLLEVLAAFDPGDPELFSLYFGCLVRELAAMVSNLEDVESIPSKH